MKKDWSYFYSTFAADIEQFRKIRKGQKVRVIRKHSYYFFKFSWTKQHEVYKQRQLYQKWFCLQTFGTRMLGVFAWLMPLSVAISTFGSANGNAYSFFFLFNFINSLWINFNSYILTFFQVPFLQLVDFAMLRVGKDISAIFYLLSIRTIWPLLQPCYSMLS